MTEKLIGFFEEIKDFTFWKGQWIKKLVYDGKGTLRGIYERKFRDKEVKEICKDNNKKVLNIKEYRYGDEGLLNKIVVKNGDGTIEYINEVIYDKEDNISEIHTTTLERKIRFSRILKFNKDRTLKDEDFKIDKDKVDVDSIDNVSSEWMFNLDKSLIQVVYKDERVILFKFSYAIRDVFLSGMDKYNIRTKRGNLFNFTKFDDIEIGYDNKGRVNKLNYLLKGQTLGNIEYGFE